jgi:pimeloyl-ACP methyl ester carboxylesterase
LPTKFAYVDGMAVHYVHAGRTTLPGVVPDLDRGELLIFLHDAGGNAGLWRRLTTVLDEHHSTIAFDFPGHGRSGGTAGLETIEAYAAFFAALAATLHTRPAVLVGHGMGAAVALRVARNSPKTVRALVLIAAAPRFEIPPEALETWRNVMHGRIPQPFTTEAFSAKTDFALMREAWMEQVKTDPRVRYYDLAACAAHDAGVDVAPIAVPTLIVSGSDDHIAPPAGAAQLQAMIGHAKRVSIEDAGHLLPIEKPQDLAAAMTSFLSDLSDASDMSDRSDGSGR